MTYDQATSMISSSVLFCVGAKRIKARIEKVERDARGQGIAIINIDGKSRRVHVNSLIEDKGKDAQIIFFPHATNT